MNSSISVVACLALLAGAMLVSASPVADIQPSSVESPCGLESVKSISTCSLCCATNRFNKFDHKLFLEKQECRCYLDQNELKLNDPKY